MSSDATDNTMRAEFEAWIVTEWPNEPWVTASDGRGGYASCSIDDAWRVWQAARADTAHQIEQAVAAERAECADMAETFKLAGFDFTGNLDLHEAIRARSTP